jgi:hypothetical protein
VARVDGVDSLLEDAEEELLLGVVPFVAALALPGLEVDATAMCPTARSATTSPAC